MAFDTQIQALAGTATQTEMDQWAADGVKEIINILPPELKMECSTITSLTSSVPMDLDAEGEVFHVTRENADSGYFIGCRKVHPILASSADDSTSLHYVTATDPIYWAESDSGGDPKLFVKPTPTDNQSAKVYHITYPDVDVSDVSAIVNFPNEAEYLVVLYAAIKVLQNKMNEKTSDLPSDISEISLDILTQSLPSSLTLPSVPSAPVMTEKSVTISGTAPIYTKPVFALEFKPNISDLSISAVSPVIPSAPSFTDISSSTISDTTINNLGVAPSYTSPTVGGVTEELTTTMDADSAGYGTDADFLNFSKWFSVAGDFIEDEEDSELAAVQLQKIQSYIQVYSQAMQNQLNTFNKENTAYQGKLQEAIQQAQINAQKAIQTANLTLQEENQEYAAKLSKYSADINKYQADVNTEVQEYQANFNKEIQLWQNSNSEGLQKYAQDIQNELNEFNKENAQYQVLLQKDLQDAELAEAKEGRDIQKYSQEIQSYSAQVAKEVQNFSADLQKYTSEVGKVTESNQSKLAKYAQDVANYGAKIQKHSIDYQWYQSQYAQLKQEYNQGIQMLVAGGVSQPQQKEQGGR